MHEAYEAVKVLKNLPLQIESLATYSDHLLLATKQGHLLMYKVGSATSSDGIKLIRSNKFFAKKPITQIEVVPDVQILISLSDNIVSTHDLVHVNFPILSTLSRTKGATLFALDVQKQETLTGEIQCTVRMCVAVKRKIQLYYWKNKEFLELTSDLCVPDVPRIMAWCGESLFVGFKSEYSLIKLTGERKDLFPTGKNPEPLMLRLENDQLALTRDKQTFFVDSDGNPTLKFAIVWTEMPIALANDPPYILSVLPNSVEVRTGERRLLIQNIDVKEPRLIVPCKRGLLFVASMCDVWCLHAVRLQNQIYQLLQEKQFELAMRLVKMTDDPEAEKQQHNQRIQNLYAFDLFCNKEFKEAMNIFLKLETDPSHVIGLFPDLLPADYRNTLEYPHNVPNLEGADLENGLFSLTEFLLQVRHRLMGDYPRNFSSMTGITEGSKTIRSKRQLLQIVDTTLLKCYLQTNDALVASLLRVQENHCHIEESERALKKHQKYIELIILYRQKGLHKKALELLSRQAKKPESPFKGHTEIIRYLQHLGEENLPLILEYASSVIKEYPMDGLKIFTEDLPEVEGLPRRQIVDYIHETNPNLAIPYLEHVIYVWKDVNSYFHNMLIHRYRESICDLMQKQQNLIGEGKMCMQAGNEPGELGMLRCKLLKFLEDSEFYTLETFPAHLLSDGLYEEAAVVMGKLGRHEEALAIYTHILKASEKAEEYCLKNYNKSRPGDKDIFVLLLKMYLSATENLSLSGLAAARLNEPNVRPNIQKALDLLKKYANKMDPLKALSHLPPTIALSDIKEFLEYVLQNTEAERHSAQLVKSLLLSEHLNVQALRIRCQSYKLVITELDVCRVCQKRIGRIAFWRFPNGVIVHYSCKEKYGNTS